MEWTRISILDRNQRVAGFLQAALVSCRVVALLRKGPYGGAAKKVAEFVQAGMIERITAGARHAHHALIILAQFQPKASALQPGKHGVEFLRHRMTA